MAPMKLRRAISYLIISFILLQGIAYSATACKDIIACGDATAGEYNLLLKVRDPSRPGYQVLWKIPKGYNYTYHLPWTGLPIRFFSSHKYIGVTSQEDVPPAIFKPGMCLTDAGIAFGDADSLSGWVNPTKHAWDDFDWIRYSCERADSTDEAVHFLTNKAVNLLHAPGVSENLLVAGPDKGYLIEADAVRYHIKKIINGVDVISNYPRELWKTQWREYRLIASSFDKENTRTIGKAATMRLNSVYGIRIKDIESNHVKVKQVPFFSDLSYVNGRIKLFNPPVKINIGERKNVGDFSVTLHQIEEGKATIHIEPKVKAWHDKMMETINQQYGDITVETMMKWSRLKSEDLDGLRGMCQPNIKYEGVAIYKIPKQYYATLSGGWFSPNHATASIYVPFHICNTNIFHPYKTGKAAELSLKLSKHYDSRLVPIIEKTEKVFLAENALTEKWAFNHMLTRSNVGKVVSTSDIFIQKQAWLMQQLFDKIKSFPSEKQQQYLDIVSSMWNINYLQTLPQMKETIRSLDITPQSKDIKNIVESLAFSICEGQIEKNRAAGINIEWAEKKFQIGKQLIEQKKYDQGFNFLTSSLDLCDQSFYGTLKNTNAPEVDRDQIFPFPTQMISHKYVDSLNLT